MGRWESPRARRGDEAATFLRENLATLHRILGSLYRVPAKDAEGLEAYLSGWFVSFACRHEIHQLPVDQLRLALLVSTCRVGCVFALCKLDGEACPDPKLKGILESDPELLASLIEEKLRLGLEPDADFI